MPKCGISRLTTAANVQSFASGNDTIDGTTVVDSLTANDVIIDASTTDTDTLNASVTVAAAGFTPTISNVENINLSVKYGSGGLSLANVTGGKVLTATSAIAGGQVDLIGAKAASTASIVAGTNVSKLTVNANATDGTAGTVNVNAGSASTVEFTGLAGKTDVFALTVAGNATIEEATLADTNDKVTLTATSDATLTTKTGGALATTNEFLGAKSITLKATAAQLGGKTVTDSTTAGTTTVEVTGTAGAGYDLSKVKSDVIEIKAVTASDEVTLSNGATVKLTLTTATGADTALDLKSSSTDDTLNLQLNGNANLTDDAVYFKTVNMTALADATLTADFDNSNVTVNVAGSKNVTFSSGTKAKALNASTLTGTLTATVNGSNAIVTGGTASDVFNLVDPADVKLVIDGTSGSADTIKVGGTVDLRNETADKTSIFTNIDKIDLNGNTLNTNQKALLANGNSWQLVNTAGGGSKAYTVTMDAAAGSLLVDLANVTTTNATFAIVGTTGADTVTGADSADVITGGGGADNLNGGSGNDTFVMATNMVSETVLATIAGSGGTDKITLEGTVKDIAFTNVTSVETVDLSAAATLTLAAKAQAAGVVTVTDTANGGGTIDASAYTTGLTVTSGTATTTVKGGSGNDTITIASGGTAAQTIQAGGGNDTITTTSGGNQVTTIKFEASATANGVDTIAGFEAGTSGTDGEILDFTAFFGAPAAAIGANGSATTTTSTITAFQTGDTDVRQIAGKVVLVDGEAALSTTTLASYFGASKPFAAAFTAGGKAIIIDGNDDAATVGANIYYVHDADGNGTVVASEIVLVGSLTTAFDLDTMTANQLA